MNVGKSLLAVLLACFTATIMLTCTRDGDLISFEELQDGTLRISHQTISLDILPSSQLLVRYRDENGTGYSMVSSSPDQATPTHFLIVDGEVVDRFNVQRESNEWETIEGIHGKGKRLIIKALADGPKNSVIEKSLQISLFEKYPDVALVATEYLVVQGDAPLELNTVYSDAFMLDRKLLESRENSYAFYGFFGVGEILPGSHGHRRGNVQAITPDLDILNDLELISGIPLTDIWAPSMGMAIASVEPKARILKMPVKVGDDGRLNISLSEEPALRLSLGDSYAGLKTAIIVHPLDYYQALQRYSQLMADQGITPKPCPDFGYDPLWCNWGYKRDWSLDHGLDRLDVFKSLGIKTVTIDDGWFDNFGDWFISEAKFPKGEEQLIGWIDKLQAQDLRTIIWWVPSIAGPVMAEDHPDWLILNKDGQPARSHWKDAFMLCPAVPEVVQYHRNLTGKFINQYGVDGFKLDGIYVAPRCYNPKHKHESPDDSYTAYEEVFKAIYETTTALKPEGDFVLGLCPCGAMASPYYLQWGNRPVTADPPRMTLSTRYRVRAYKALLGPASCVDNDFHERYNDYFPVEVGCGGLVTTKFSTLSDYEFPEFKKWYDLYNQHGLSSGDYLALYDIGFENPEIYTIRKGDFFYYTILRPGINGPEGVPWFEHEIEQRTEMLQHFENELAQIPIWQGRVELRGLEDRAYSAYNIESGEMLGNVHGPIGELEITFRDHLILQVLPE